MRSSACQQSGRPLYAQRRSYLTGLIDLCPWWLQYIQVVSTASAKELEAAVKRHRKAKGLSQLELAEAIGVPYSTIYRLERGDARPQRLKRIAGGLGEALFELASLASPGSGASAGVRGRPASLLSDESLRKVERYVERIEKQEGGHDSERAR